MQTRATFAIPVAAALLLVGACGDDGGKDAEGEGGSTQSCAGLLKSADPTAALPEGLPKPDGATFYELQTQGATKRYFAYVDGSDLVATRDAVKSAFEKAGIEIEGTDQEEGTEAEFEFKQNATEGSVQVITLCEGKLRLRYRVGPQ